MAQGLREEGHPVVEVPVTHQDLHTILKPYSPEKYTVLNWCEELPGIPHSDVLVAEILENLGFAYTGASSRTLALSWDKAAVKRLLCENDIPVPFWQVFSKPETDSWDCFPAIVKPASEHCSYGVSAEAVVMDPVELEHRIAYVLETFKQPAIVEDFIDGREFHVSLWGHRRIEMLPPAEMDFTAFDRLQDRLCSFDSKFKPGSLPYEKINMCIPAKLTVQETRRLKQIALQAYRTVGCRDYARIDLRLRQGIFYVLDVNPNADLSPETSMIYAAEKLGLTYGDVGSRLVKLASRRRPAVIRRRTVRLKLEPQVVME